jgi:putative molybdopterin biosynthesis protein
MRNSLREVRTRLGISQQELAARAGVSRQTVSGVEAGLYAPSAPVALRLARALGCRVEDLFWLEQDLPSVEAVPAAGTPPGNRLRLALARIGGRWVAHPLMGDAAFRTELVPTDGEAPWDGRSASLHVRPLDDPQSLLRTVVLAGCTPATSLWARAAERWHPGLRVHWVFANSTDALRRLARGEVHAAGVHLFDPATGEHNIPFVRRLLPDRQVVLVNLGVWEEGLLVAPGNPLQIRAAADLTRVRLVNREPGSGSRQLLERVLAQEQIPPESVPGFDRTVSDHLEVAREVLSGKADTGVSAAAVAAAFGLGFLPLHRVRYDIAVCREYLDEEPVRQLLGTLSHRHVRSQLEALGGYDTARTGDVVATVGQ